MKTGRRDGKSHRVMMHLIVTSQDFYIWDVIVTMTTNVDVIVCHDCLAKDGPMPEAVRKYFAVQRAFRKAGQYIRVRNKKFFWRRVVWRKCIKRRMALENTFCLLRELDTLEYRITFLWLLFIIQWRIVEVGFIYEAKRFWPVPRFFNLRNVTESFHRAANCTC